MRGTGFVMPHRWPTIEEIAGHSRRMAAASVIERFVPTSLGVPTICDQGGSSSCFGFAAAQGIHIDRQAHGVASKIPSPVVPYWFARREAVAADTDIADDGSDPDSMMQALADFGDCPWEDAPFVEAEVNARPNDLALLAAQKLRCTLRPILSTGAELWTAIRHVIQMERHPVLIALNVVPNFDNPTNGVVDDATGRSRGLHAQAIFGFDNVGAFDAGSWGTDDGINGIKTLTPRFLASAVVWAGSLEVGA